MPLAWAHSAVVMTMAPAPSLMPEALAAVTVPSFLKTGRSRAIDSLPNRERNFSGARGESWGCSSISTVCSPRRVVMVTGVISLA